jgi:signal transduction histidine kinase
VDVAVSSALRRDFVVTAAHELRTPLASLHLMLDLLREDLRADQPDLDDARDLAERAAAQSSRIIRLAGQLLDLGRLDSGAPFAREPVDLRSLACSVITEFEPVSGGAIELRAIDEHPVEALADAEAVAQVLRILLDNALRFAPIGTAIPVLLRRRGATAYLAVCDGGSGVPPQDRERIFARFERGHDEGDRTGTGLGLAIGRGLARRMGGELELSSAAAPTCFTMRLPALVPAAVGDSGPSTS